jgi:hypothetical protein
VLSWVAVLAVAGASIALGASVLRSHTSSVRLDNVRTVAEHGSISAIDHRDAQVVRARHAPDQTVAEHGSINAIDHRDAVADRP